MSPSDILPLIPQQFSLVKLSGVSIILKQQSPMEVGERGVLLLDMERKLRAKFGTMCEVFLEPGGDLNVLRVKLRGVKLI